MARKSILNNPEYTEIFFMVFRGTKNKEKITTNEDKQDIRITKRELLEEINKKRISSNSVNNVKISDTLICNKMKYLSNKGLIKSETENYKFGHGKNTTYYTSHYLIYQFLCDNFFVSKLDELNKISINSVKTDKIDALEECIYLYLNRLLETKRYIGKTLNNVFLELILGFGRYMDSKVKHDNFKVFLKKADDLLLKEKVVINSFFMMCWRKYVKQIQNDLNYTAFNLAHHLND